MRDRELTLSLAQAVTASTRTTDIYDQGAPRENIVMGKLFVEITVDEAVAAAGAATVTFQMQCDSDPAFGSPKTVDLTTAIAKADLVPGKLIQVALPSQMNERYLAGYYAVATGPLTAGKFTFAIVDGLQANTHYPDAI